MGGSPIFRQMWSKMTILMEFQVPITFFLLIGWRRLIYEKNSKFYELFEKQHRGTQKLTRTPEISLVGFIAKNGQKPICHTSNFFDYKLPKNDVLMLEIAKTHQNSKKCRMDF